MEENDEMKTQHLTTKRRRGQTLAEFALTLPILLILVFGIIEFARIFQAWVTLQNAARLASRYASTGQYDENRYADLDDLVPCKTNDDARGTNTTPYKPVPGNDAYTIDVYTGGEESLFATWYDGENCDGGQEQHLVWRKDILRIMSIMDEARRGAAGLSIESNPVENTRAGIQDTLYGIWDIPMERSDQPGWFNVMMCSSRAKINSKSGTVDIDREAYRFVTVLNAADDKSSGQYYEPPFCMLNEIQPPAANPGLPGGATENYEKRWLDAGGPGDQVTIVVTFNHPLITPLGLAPYIRLQARRAAVNESFLVARGSVGLPPGGSVPLENPTATLAPSLEPPPTDTPSATWTNTPRPPTETPTPPPDFSCDAIEVQNVNFFENRFYIDVQNNNVEGIELVRVRLNWSGTANWDTLKLDYPNMYLSAMALESEIHWTGPDTVPNTDAIKPEDPCDPATSDGWVCGSSTYIPGVDNGVWEGAFNNGPYLNQYVDQWDFGGSVFSFQPDIPGAPICDIALYLPDPPDPTEIPPDYESPTPTYTPDCASDELWVRFDGFDTFGVVRLSIVNERYAVAPFTGFDIDWIKRSGAMTLDKVAVGGTNPDDSMSVVVWQHPIGDETPPTNSYSEGNWLTDFTFPPNSITPLYLDFGGTSQTLQAAFGVTPSDFNGTWFEIGCGASGAGSGGAGTIPSGLIHLSEAPTPAPTNTPRPTNTVGPTYTPSATRPTATPSTTKTPAPPTTTMTPAPASNTPIPPTPTIPQIGGVGGSG